MAKWNIPSIYLPQVYGAVGNDTTVDDTDELQAMIDALVAAQVNSTHARSKIIIDGGDRIWSVSRPIVIPGTNHVEVRSLQMVAIGTSWTSADYMLDTSASNSNYYGVVLNCNALANGVKDSGGYSVWHYPVIFKMSPDWASVGYLNNNGTGKTLITPNIYQWNSAYDVTRYADEANFTATCVKSIQSDDKILGGFLGSAKVLYAGNGGVHELSGVHLWNGRIGRTPESPQLVEFGKDSPGTLALSDCYFDGGVVDIYGGSSEITGRALLDPAQATYSNGFLRFYNMGEANLKAQGRIKLITLGTTNFMTLNDYAGNLWATSQRDVATKLNTAISGEAFKNGLVVTFGYRTFNASFNGNGSYTADFPVDNSWVNWTNNTGGLQLAALSAEPVHTGNNFFALSDGTPSTARFGTDGERPYHKASNGNWYPMGEVMEYLTIADGSTGTFTCPRPGGFASIVCEGQNGASSPSPQWSGEVWFDTAASLAIIKGTAFTGVSANFDVVTTNVTGTTGTAGNVTVAVRTGALKIENRTGASRTFRITTR